MTGPRIALAALWLSAAVTARAAETQWRFDGTVDSVYGPWSQLISAGAPIRGLFVLDRSVSYVQQGDPCTDGAATRSFFALRAAQFSVAGVSGSATTGVPPGVDCAPDGACSVVVNLQNELDPPGCRVSVYEVDFDVSPLASAQLGPVSLTFFLAPALSPPAFYATIPDPPWAIATGTSAMIQSAQGEIVIAVSSLTRDQVCGDIDLDLDVDATDLALLRAALANPAGAPLPPGGAARCSVIGGATDCDVVDVAVLKRALSPGPPALPPGVQQVCAAMNGG
ncbi:MAG TPA: hypothetical protein VMR86_21900 [Myxococcota bacterium]|nr:hypothetical protein [Myxococcota bacterium]